jgi:hypothetical protein
MTRIMFIKVPEIAKLLSLEWSTMDPEAMDIWKEAARVDRVRYDSEKAIFLKGASRTGYSRRILKDPGAPKRNMSAFLAFSNKRRAETKRLHPRASNAEVSKMLSTQWKEIDPKVKASYVDEEAALRTQYKIDIAEWKRRKAVEARSVGRKSQVAHDKAVRESVVWSPERAAAAKVAVEEHERKIEQKRQQVLHTTLSAADSLLQQQQQHQDDWRRLLQQQQVGEMGPYSWLAANSSVNHACLQQFLLLNRYAALQRQQEQQRLALRLSIGMYNVTCKLFHET